MAYKDLPPQINLSILLLMQFKSSKSAMPPNVYK